LPLGVAAAVRRRPAFRRGRARARGRLRVDAADASPSSRSPLRCRTCTAATGGRSGRFRTARQRPPRRSLAPRVRG